MYRGKVTAVDASGVYVQTAEYGTLGPCQFAGSPMEVGDSALVVDVGDAASPDLVVAGRIDKPGQFDQIKVYTSGSFQYVVVQGYNLRIQSNGSAAYFQVAYGGGFTFAGAKVTVPASLGVELGSSGPTITAGAGVPSSTPPDGSLYLRTDGGAGSTLYVRESGSWAAK